MEQYKMKGRNGMDEREWGKGKGLNEGKERDEEEVVQTLSKTRQCNGEKKREEKA